MAIRELTYAPTTPADRQRRLRRRLVRIAAVLAIVPIAVVGLPRAWRFGQILHWQHQAMVLTVSPDQVVYEDDPVEVAKLLKLKGFTSLNGAAVREEKVVSDFYEAYSPPGRRHTPVLFVHERRNSRGESRLVILAENVSTASGWVPSPVLIIQPPMIAQPGGVFSGIPTWKGNLFDPLFVPLAGGPNGHVRLYAGQPDPSDESHFTIAGTRDGVPFIIDSWLTDDDQISMKIRDEKTGPSR